MVVPAGRIYPLACQGIIYRLLPATALIYIRHNHFQLWEDLAVACHGIGGQFLVVTGLLWPALTHVITTAEVLSAMDQLDRPMTPLIKLHTLLTGMGVSGS